jgi:hypothetical protein
MFNGAEFAKRNKESDGQRPPPWVATAAARPGGARSILELHRRRRRPPIREKENRRVPLPLHQVNG